MGMYQLHVGLKGARTQGHCPGRMMQALAGKASDHRDPRDKPMTPAKPFTLQPPRPTAMDAPQEKEASEESQ